MKALKTIDFDNDLVKQLQVLPFYRGNIRKSLPSTQQLLTEGGDDRIMIDAERGTNRYGCRAYPDPELAAFGSSTASVISVRGFAAAARLRRGLLTGDEPEAVSYALELDRIRQELLQLYGLSDLFGLETVFAASGTDIHLIAGQLAGGTDISPALAVMVDAVETGRCVPAALAGRHFGTRTAQGAATVEGAPLAFGNTIEVAAVAMRLENGNPRQAEDIDAEVESLVSKAALRGRRVLLTLVDVSKTGMIAPSVGCVMSLRERFPDQVEVLVDACQFRIAPSTLRAYLQQGFMVAVTGSKFVTGPTFSGALLVPETVAQQLRGRVLSPALRDYSSRIDWPQDWKETAALKDGANFGLLLRWEAALQELRAFRAVPETEIAAFLQDFAHAVQAGMANDPVFVPLPAPPLDRSPLVESGGWDSIPTIFPFVLYHRATRHGSTPLSRDETAQVYRLLQEDVSDHPDLSISDDATSLRCQLGQPVACGSRDGVEVSALRLCVSARLIVEATAPDGLNKAKVIERALVALDKTAALVT